MTDTQNLNGRGWPLCEQALHPADPRTGCTDSLWVGMSADPTLRAKVFEALSNAEANGYDMRTAAAADIAIDLADYDADIEGANVCDILDHIEEWRRSAIGGRSD